MAERIDLIEPFDYFHSDNGMLIINGNYIIGLIKQRLGQQEAIQCVAIDISTQGFPTIQRRYLGADFSSAIQVIRTAAHIYIARIANHMLSVMTVIKNSQFCLDSTIDRIQMPETSAGGTIDSVEVSSEGRFFCVALHTATGYRIILYDREERVVQTILNFERNMLSGYQSLAWGCTDLGFYNAYINRPYKDRFNYMIIAGDRVYVYDFTLPGIALLDPVPATSNDKSMIALLTEQATITDDFEELQSFAVVLIDMRLFRIERALSVASKPLGMALSPDKQILVLVFKMNVYVRDSQTGLMLIDHPLKYRMDIQQEHFIYLDNDFFYTLMAEVLSQPQQICKWSIDRGYSLKRPVHDKTVTEQPSYDAKRTLTLMSALRNREYNVR